MSRAPTGAPQIAAAKEDGYEDPNCLAAAVSPCPDRLFRRSAPRKRLKGTRQVPTVHGRSHYAIQYFARYHRLERAGRRQAGGVVRNQRRVLDNSWAALLESGVLEQHRLHLDDEHDHDVR